MEDNAKILLRLGWAIIVVCALSLAGFTFIYFSFQPNVFFLLKKQDVVFNVFWRTAFYLHITGGMLALSTGPFQFIRNFRNKHLHLHRTLGKIYLMSIFFLGAPAGLFMAFYAEGGLFSSMGFCLMALLWLFTTWRAYECILEKKITDHRNWMLRSYALTFAAVTLRLWVPFGTRVLFIDKHTVVVLSAWISWIPNLIVAQLLTKISRKII